MLLSMTGFGEAQRQAGGLSVAAEIRTINSRYFKLSLKCGEGHSALEPEIESLVRQKIRRGTVQVSLRVDRSTPSDYYRIDRAVLASYRRQIDELKQEGLADDIGFDTLVNLPGVISENSARRADVAGDWPLIQEALTAAMENLAIMRAEEGRVMAEDLRLNCRTIASELNEIERRAPIVTENYRARLEERLNKILADRQTGVTAADLIKEVSIFAERSDISEEIVRLRSHLEQFETIMNLPESSGRKLEFLTQEMFRESNTIGSKSNDVQISRHVIEIKAAIERIREMIQNVE